LAIFGPRGRAKRSFYFLVLAVVILVADLKIFVRVLCSSVEKEFPAAGNLVAKVNIANKYTVNAFSAWMLSIDIFSKISCKVNPFSKRLSNQSHFEVQLQLITLGIPHNLDIWERGNHLTFPNL